MKFVPFKMRSYQREIKKLNRENVKLRRLNHELNKQVSDYEESLKKNEVHQLLNYLKA